MAKLTEEAKTFIVQRLAMFDTPTQVVDAVKEEFGLVVTRQHVQSYDPSVGPKPAKKWIALFEATRENFLDRVSEIPIANRAVRLRRLERMSTKAEDRKNYPLAVQIIEQAAKEVGDAYTNTRNLKHSGRIDSNAAYDDMSDAELAAHVAQLASDLVKDA